MIYLIAVGLILLMIIFILIAISEGKTELSSELAVDIKFMKEYRKEAYKLAIDNGIELTSEYCKQNMLKNSDYKYPLNTKFGEWKNVEKHSGRNEYGCYYWYHIIENVSGKKMEIGNDELDYAIRCADPNDYFKRIGKM